MSDARRDAMQNIKRMVQSQFADRSPDEDRIRNQINVLISIEPDLTESDGDVLFDEICEAMNVRMDLGILIHAQEHKPWLVSRNPEWKVWKAYNQVLSEEGRSAQVLDTLDTSLNQILDHLGDPEDLEPWARRGLIIGEVQSGKTSTYIGLIDKAIDVGYRVVVLLGGNTELLRRQTQERVDFGVIGRDSSTTNRQSNTSNLIGIGNKLDSTAFIDSLTTQVIDFRTASALAHNIIPGPDKVIVFVTKKNKTVLEQIAKWFERKPVGTENLPMLLIDDESDYASVNTNDPEKDPTAINAAIRRILSFFNRSSYVAFTATPFANIFIDDTIEEDLFPRDLIYSLETPTNYFGCSEYFSELGPTSLIRTVDDAIDYFPLGHKRTLPVPLLPESLIESIRTYFLTNALRDLRGQRGAPTSMLINVSRFVDVQKQVFDLVSGEVANYRNAIDLHSLDYANGVHNPFLSRLEDTFGREFPNCDFDWHAVLSALRIANHDVVPLITNASSARLDIMPNRHVSIGGDLLSRGLTLEGLSTSYFYRKTQAADTLMQMARWFGYRAGYGDLCRVWITEDMCGAFQHALGSLADLRIDIKEMERQQLTPKQFGISVRLHPDALAITARNKIRSGKSHVGQKSISLRGSAIESTRLSTDPVLLKDNVVKFESLIKAISEQSQVEQARGSRFIWRNIDKQTISDFILGFSVHPGWSQRLFEGRSLSDFVKHAYSDDLQAWDVVVMGGDGERQGPFDFGGLPDNWKPPIRTFGGSLTEGWTVSGKRMRILGPRDVGTTLTDSEQRIASDEFKAILDNEEKATIPDRAYIKHLHRPVLLVYPIEAKKSATWTGPEIPKTPMIAIVIVVPGDRSDGDQDNLKYVLNTTAQRLWNPDFMDDVEDLGDDDE
jgi:hypothetical protein